MLKRSLLLAVSAVLVVGCTPVDHGFGETHRWNIEQQVVDPDPQYAGDEIEGGSGVRGAEAARRYRTGQVRQPARSSSGSSSSSSSSSSSTSGGPQ